MARNKFTCSGERGRSVTCKGKKFNELNSIIEFESGNPTSGEFIELFSNLVKNGHAWSLQGNYGRTAQGLISRGILDKKGKINKKKITELGINLDTHIYDE